MERSVAEVRDGGQGGVFGVRVEREGEGHGFGPHLCAPFQERSWLGLPSLRRSLSPCPIPLLVRHPHMFLCLCKDLTLWLDWITPFCFFLFVSLYASFHKFIGNALKGELFWCN